MIDRSAPTPLYYQLKQLLKQLIQKGDLRPGDRLPTEQELCARYSISRAPVRQALAELVREGYVIRRAGAGTFVATGAQKLHVQKTPYRLLANDVRWISWLEHTIQHWNGLHPGHQVMLEIEMPDRSAFHQTLRDAAVQGNAHDMVAVDYVWLTGYARSSYLFPFDDLDQDWTAELVTSLEAPVRQNHLVEGKLFGFPMQADVTGLWYRRDWFEEADLVPPTTWDELLALLAQLDRSALRERFGYQSPLAFPSGIAAGEATVNILLPFIWNAGGRVLDAQGHSALNDPAVIRALYFLQSITFEHHYVLPEARTYHWWDAPRALANGRLPMIFGGTYEWPTICEASNWETEDALLNHLGFVPMPRPSREMPATASLGGTSWGILRQSRLKGLSLDLMKLAVSSEWNAAFYEETLQISPFRALNQQLKERHPWLKTVIPLMDIARPRPMLKQYVRLSLFLQQMFEQILWEGAPVEKIVSQTSSYLNLFITNHG